MSWEVVDMPDGEKSIVWRGDVENLQSIIARLEEENEKLQGVVDALREYIDKPDAEYWEILLDTLLDFDRWKAK